MSKINEVIKIEQIMDVIENQIRDVMIDDYDFYEGTDVILSNEQQYIKNKERKDNCIYMVLKFSPVEVNQGQIVMPITINAMSEHNNIEKCQRLLLELSQRYNLEKPSPKTIVDNETNESDNYLINQLYDSPQNVSNFNEVFTGFRSVFYMTGTFLISRNANTFELYYRDTPDGELKKIETLSNYMSFDINLDSQPFFNTENRTKSVGRYGTLGIGFTAFLIHGSAVDGQLQKNFFDRLLDIIAKRKANGVLIEGKGVDTKFYFTLKYESGIALDLELKLGSYRQQSSLGEIPVANIVMTE